jgi:hypothetical protein
MIDKIELSLAEKAYEFTDIVFGGVHRVKTLEDRHHYCLLIPRQPSLATYDDSLLTRVVIASHELGLRAEITNNGMHGLKLLLHSRSVRDGGELWQRHPTLDRVLNGT